MIEIIIGFILDFIIGDPQNPFHPVRGIAKVCTFLEKIFRKIMKKYLKAAGLITALITIIFTFVVTYYIVYFAQKIDFYFGMIVKSIIIYFCISGKGLMNEGIKIVKLLIKDDIEGARHALSYIVGRDTQALDKEGIIRAVIETIAENMSDGVIAPLFYCGIFGPPLSMAYKAVNTMDSMFGYKNEKYMDFGYFPAKIDDVFNFIPARLSGVIIAAASFICRYDYKNCWKIFLRDRRNHTSPNSAHPEAAMAGSLGLKLGGPNYYFGKIVVKPYIGDELKKIDIADVKKCNNILMISTVLGVFLAILIRLFLANIVNL